MDCEICFWLKTSSFAWAKTLIRLVYLNDLCSMKNTNPHAHKCYTVERQILFHCCAHQKGKVWKWVSKWVSNCTYCTILWIKQVLHVIGSPRTLDSSHQGAQRDKKKHLFIIISCTRAFYETLAITNICICWYSCSVINNLSQNDKSLKLIFICICISLISLKGQHILYWWFTSRDSRSCFPSPLVSSTLTCGTNPTDIISPEFPGKEKQPSRCLGYDEY